MYIYRIGSKLKIKVGLTSQSDAHHTVAGVTDKGGCATLDSDGRTDGGISSLRKTIVRFITQLYIFRFFLSFS